MFDVYNHQLPPLPPLLPLPPHPLPLHHIVDHYKALVAVLG